MMNPETVALFILPCMFGGAWLGLNLRPRIPDINLDAETRRSIDMALGLIITMTAVILGFVVASAKNNFDSQDVAIKESAATILTLDRMLTDYGPEATPIRMSIRAVVGNLYEKTWGGGFQAGELDKVKSAPMRENILAHIQALTPKTDAQRWLQDQALQLGIDVLKIRSLVLERVGSTVPLIFLVILTFWLTLIFFGFGLLTIRNPTIIVVFLLCALSVAAAIFLILELDGPFDGCIKISGEPFRYLLACLGQ